MCSTWDTQVVTEDGTVLTAVAQLSVILQARILSAGVATPSSRVYSITLLFKASQDLAINLSSA